MNRKELADRLELVGTALADNDLVQLFQCFCFNTKTVSAYNDALGIVAPCEAAEPFAVKGDVLLGLITNSMAEDVELKVAPDAVVIKTGRSTFSLPYHPKDDFLFEPPEPGKDALLIPIDQDLISGLNACLLTSSTDNAQPALMGICLAQVNDRLMIYSTDGDAISRYAPNKAMPKGMQRRILPNSFCVALIKIMAETKCAKGSMLITDEWAAAYLESEYKIYGRLLQVDEPIDYEKEIAGTAKGKSTPVAIPKELDKALSRARVLSDPESAKTLLAVEAKRLKLLTKTSMGVVNDSIKLEHPDVQANVSAQLIQRCIGLCDEMYIRDNCVEFWGGEGHRLYIIISNMGD